MSHTVFDIFLLLFKRTYATYAKIFIESKSNFGNVSKIKEICVSGCGKRLLIFSVCGRRKPNDRQGIA